MLPLHAMTFDFFTVAATAICTSLNELEELRVPTAEREAVVVTFAFTRSETAEAARCRSTTHVRSTHYRRCVGLGDFSPASLNVRFSPRARIRASGLVVNFKRFLLADRFLIGRGSLERWRNRCGVLLKRRGRFTRRLRPS